MPCHVRPFRWLPLVAACTVALPLAAQQGRVFTNADYDHAMQVSGGGGGGGRGGAAAGPGTVAPHWIAGGKLWYRNVDGDASTFYLVDPVKKTKLPAFNHVALATALSKVAGKTFEATKLPFNVVVFSPDQKTISFNVDAKGYSCGVSGSSCRALAAGGRAARMRRRKPAAWAAAVADVAGAAQCRQAVAVGAAPAARRSRWRRAARTASSFATGTWCSAIPRRSRTRR